MEDPLINPVPSAAAQSAPAVVADAGNATPEKHLEMAQVLTTAIEVGKQSVPDTHTPLVSKPDQLESWRIFKIMAEFVDGFNLISRYSLSVTFFGTARHTFSDQTYMDATNLAGKLAKAGYAIITGGGSGIMEAANKGAFEAGGSSIGLNIRLDDHQVLNKYVTDSMTFDHFFVRKVMLTFASSAYIYFPGGYGTLDEFTEILTLVQTKKIKPVPIVLYGKEYWTPLLEIFENQLEKKDHAIDAADLQLYHLVDSVDEAFEYLSKNVKPR